MHCVITTESYISRSFFWKVSVLVKQIINQRTRKEFQTSREKVKQPHLISRRKKLQIVVVENLMSASENCFLNNAFFYIYIVYETFEAILIFR